MIKSGTQWTCSACDNKWLVYQAAQPKQCPFCNEGKNPQLANKWKAMFGWNTMKEIIATLPSKVVAEFNKE